MFLLKKKWSLVVGGLVCYSLFSLCAVSIAQKLTLNVWRPAGERPEGVWWDDEGQILDLFEALYPKIKVKITDIPFEQYDTKQITAISGGAPPDLAFVNHVTVGALVGTGGIEPLDKYIKDSVAINLEDYIPGMRKVGYINGHQYTLPWDTDTRILWYNRHLFEEAGIKNPPKYWDEWLADLEKIKSLNKPGVYGYSFFGGSYWGVLYQDVGPWLVQKETSLINDEGTKSKALDPKTVDAFNFALKLAKFAPSAAVTYVANDLDTLFAQGKLATYVWGMWYQDYLRKHRPDWKFGVDYDIALLPAPRGGHTGSSNGGWQLAIFKDAKHKQEAWALLEFVSWPGIMAIGTKNHIPTRISGSTAPWFHKDPFINLSLKQASYGQPPVPCVEELPEIAQSLHKVFLRTVTGEITSEEALETLDEKINKLLK